MAFDGVNVYEAVKVSPTLIVLVDGETLIPVGSIVSGSPISFIVLKFFQPFAEVYFDLQPLGTYSIVLLNMIQSARSSCALGGVSGKHVIFLRPSQLRKLYTLTYSTDLGITTSVTSFKP